MTAAVDAVNDLRRSPYAGSLASRFTHEPYTQE
jgi:hypothetical protein